jgi:flagellar hook assembly protein FlgD
MPEVRFSPNGDGAGDKQALSFKIVRQSTVTATLTGPGGVTRTIDQGERSPGVYRFDWSGRTNGAAEPEGRWRLTVNTVDFEGKGSSAERAFFLNNTLGYITVKPLRATVHRKRGGRVTIGFRLTRPSQITVAIMSKTGQLLRVVRSARGVGPGRVTATWSGKYPNGKAVFSGTYVAKVTAISRAGKAELARSFRVRRR